MLAHPHDAARTRGAAVTLNEETPSAPCSHTAAATTEWVTTRAHRMHRVITTVVTQLIGAPTSWFHPFTWKRFHVLLNSLFKVLCNFPSRYLFAIGLAAVFSLTRNLPGALACTLKQTDSSEPRSADAPPSRQGTGTLSGVSFESTCKTAARLLSSEALTWHPALTLPKEVARLHAGLFPFRSPLLRESLLVSFPPLSDMLKFGG